MMVLKFAGPTGAPLSFSSDYMAHRDVDQVAADARRNVEFLTKVVSSEKHWPIFVLDTRP
jgi:hypothetical protein